jgi:uncharacterized protein (DUF433 family)
MADIIYIDPATRMNRRLSKAVWIERRAVFINGTRKHVAAFISEWLDGSSVVALASRYGIKVEQAEDVIRWWQREQFSKYASKITQLKNQAKATR